MSLRAIIALCLIVLFVGVAVSAVAQDEDEGDKPEGPRFFFEKKGGLAKPADEGEEKGEAEEAEVEDEAREEEPKAERRPAPVKPAFGFETKAALANWHATDQEAILDITTEEGVAHAGDGCLRLTYMPREGAFEQISAGPLQTGGGETLSFWIKTDFPTNLTFGVVERGGAFYQQFCATPADEWTHVSLPLSSLILAQDTRDAIARLEPESIVEVRLADLANLPGALGDALGRKAGVQQLFLDDLAITDEEAPAPGAAGAAPLLADGFERDAIHALAIGDSRLRKDEGADGGALEIICEDRAQRWMGFVMAVGQLDLADAETLSLKLKASQPLMMNVTLEEWDNSKYSQRVRIDPDAGWVEKQLVLDELLLETDADDENGQLDSDQIRVLVIVADMTRVDEFPVTFGVDDVAFR